MLNIWLIAGLLIFAAVTMAQPFAFAEEVYSDIIIPESITQLDWLQAHGYKCVRDGAKYYCYRK